MEITVGLEFKRPVGNKYIKCVVSDIFDIQTTSRSTGKVNNRVVYYAKSTEFGMGEGFEVAKNTILRGLNR